MTPLQKRKFEQLIDRRQYDSARKFLDGLAQAGDKEAKTLRLDMDITYPITTAQKAAKGLNRIVFAVMLGIAGIFLLSLVLMLLQR